MWEIVVTACFLLPPTNGAPHECFHKKSGTDGAVFSTLSQCKRQARMSKADWMMRAQIIGAEVSKAEWECQRYQPSEDT